MSTGRFLMFYCYEMKLNAHINKHSHGISFFGHAFRFPVKLIRNSDITSSSNDERCEMRERKEGRGTVKMKTNKEFKKRIGLKSISEKEHI